MLGANYRSWKLYRDRRHTCLISPIPTKKGVAKQGLEAKLKELPYIDDHLYNTRPDTQTVYHSLKKKKILALGVGEYTFNPRTQQIEAGRSL